MSSLKQIQQDFLHFLLHGNGPFAEHVVNDQGNISAEQRVSIYGNAYRIRLQEVVETDHEILGLYLGDELFDQMFAGYLDAYPSKFDSLRHFCQFIPKYLANNAPFSEHPILAELASFERLLLAAFDAAEVERASPQDLAVIAPELWPTIQVRFHPSVQLFSERYNAVRSWQAIKGNQAPAPAAKHSEEQHWLLWRNHDRLTEFRSLEADERYMIEQYLQGADFADICEGLLTWHAPEQVPVFAVQSLQSWLQQGLIYHFKTAD